MRAFGKLILLGEHTVVYGVPALVAGIELGVSCSLTLGGERRSLTLLGRDCEGGELAQAFEALLDEGGAPARLHAAVAGDLPPGMGLGFSAAAGVAIARAVEAIHRPSPTGGKPDDARVQARATAWERVFHGNPSGVDVAAAMYGSVSRFCKGEPMVRVHVEKPLTIAVGLTGTSSSTKRMVSGVARLKERKPELVQRSLDAVRALVDNAISAVQHGDHIALGELMDLNQMVLAGFDGVDGDHRDPCGRRARGGRARCEADGRGWWRRGRRAVRRRGGR